MKNKISDALIAFAATPEGLDVLKKLSSVTGLKKITDSEYDSTRAAVKELGEQSRESANSIQLLPLP